MGNDRPLVGGDAPEVEDSLGLFDAADFDVDVTEVRPRDEEGRFRGDSYEVGEFAEDEDASKRVF